MAVGERIREERDKRGWTQGDLSEHSGTNRDTISGIESGRHRPRPSTLRKIAVAFGLEVRDLFEDVTARPKAQAASPSFEDLVEKSRILEEARREVRREFFKQAETLSDSQLKQLRNSLQRSGAAARLERPELWKDPRSKWEEIASRVFIIGIMLQVRAGKASERQREELAALVG